MIVLEKDIVVIGGGPGGYVAAIRAAQLGANVCVIEKEKIGGTCLNKGCIPTKTLYRNAEILESLKNIYKFGIEIGPYEINPLQMQKRKQEVVDQLVSGIVGLLKANKVELIYGTAVLKDRNSISVSIDQGETLEISAKNIIIATGSKPSIPPIPGVELKGIFTSEEMLDFKTIPKSLAIVGGGVIGMEFAAIFNSLGSKVTVLEFLPNILAQVDVDLTKRLAPSLKKKGMDIHTSTKVTKIEKQGENFIIFAQNKKGEIEIAAENVLIAVGRTPNTEALNLKEVGITYDKKGIHVDKNMETNIKGIYAIGDVNGKLMLAHEASYQGVCVAENIFNITDNVGAMVVPNCIFIFPEIAAVGLTEEEAKQKEILYKTSKFMFGANGKALALGEPEGLVKVLCNEKDELIGVHIMGPHASDLIHEATLAISNSMKIEEIKKTIHAHPTLSEAFFEAVMGLKGEAIHMTPSRK